MSSSKSEVLRYPTSCSRPAQIAKPALSGTMREKHIEDRAFVTDAFLK